MIAHAERLVHKVVQEPFVKYIVVGEMKDWDFDGGCPDHSLFLEQGVLVFLLSLCSTLGTRLLSLLPIYIILNSSMIR